MIAVKIINPDGIAAIIAYLVPYAVIGWDILWKSVRNICHGQIFDENFLMTVATIGAMCTGEFSEGVAVMLFYQVGELFQSYAVGRQENQFPLLWISVRITPTLKEIIR